MAARAQKSKGNRKIGKERRKEMDGHILRNFAVVEACPDPGCATHTNVETSKKLAMKD